MNSMSNVLVSVIIPCYNVERYVEECVRSVINQTHKNLEIIAVNDGATDRTGEILYELAQNEPRLHVYMKENGGLSDARNYGIKHATGEYVTFVDSDDLLAPTFIGDMLQALYANGADIVCSLVSLLDDATGKRKDLRVLNDVTEYTDYRDVISRIYSDLDYKICLVVAYAKMCRREKYKDFEFPKGRICEDAFSILEFLSRMKKIVVIPDTLYIYRKRNNSITANRDIRYLYAELDWRIHHMDYWEREGDEVMLDKIVFDLIYYLYNNRKQIEDGSKAYYKEQYQRCWEFLMKRGQLSLKRKIKFLTYANPLFF